MSEYSYPLDITGVAESNRIVREEQVLTDSNFKGYAYVIPTFAPFYLYDIIVEHINEDGSTTEVNWTLLSPDDKSKLDSITEGAEPNYIKAVVEEFNVINGTLGINQIPISKITDLNDQLNVIQSNVSSLDKIINGTTAEEGQIVQGVVAKLEDLTTTVNNLSNNFVNYVTVQDFNTVVGNLEEMKINNTNIMEDIDGIKEILSWKDI